MASTNTKSIPARSGGQARKHPFAELVDDVDGDTFMVGPLVYRVHHGQRQWYFALASTIGGEFWSIACLADHPGADRDKADQIRREAIDTIHKRRPSATIHQPTTEPDAARLCEQLWPSETTAKLRANVEAEYAERSADDCLFAEYPLVAPAELVDAINSGRGGLFHAVYRHEDWCPALKAGGVPACTCDPDVTYHRPPAAREVN